MIDKCTICLKKYSSDVACDECTYIVASNSFDQAFDLLHIDMSVEDAEEVKYELWCALHNEVKREGNDVMSALANILAKCADTAVYLPKKRFENLDDFKVILFDPELNQAFMTNNDVCIKLSHFNPRVLNGLDPDQPAYDYLNECFIPNPLPYSVAELNDSFPGEFVWNITLPVTYLLDKLYRICPEAIQRRNTFFILDVGYGMFEGSLVIPEFKPKDSDHLHYMFSGGLEIMIDGNSHIQDGFIYRNTTYVGLPMRQNGPTIYVDVYKEFASKVNIGIYKIISDVIADDIHPFSLSDYADSHLIHIPLASAEDSFENEEQKMRVYKDFTPIALETEYIYEILLLFGNFGYEYVNLYVSSKPEDSMLITGVGVFEDIPIIEAAIAPVIIGRSGSECEQILQEETIPF